MAISRIFGFGLILGCALPVWAEGALDPIRVVMTRSETSRPLHPEFLGYNANLSREGSWQDGKLIEVFRQLSPGHVRYPAGTIANYWDWRRGWFIEGMEVPNGLHLIPENPYPLEDLKTVWEATGAEPVYVVNMLHSTLDEQLAMLRAARDLGLPVRWVELGNEYYLSTKDYVARFPDAKSYAEESRRWTEAIRAEFPTAKVAVVGAAVRATDDERRQTWNRELLAAWPDPEAITLHVYQGAGLAGMVDRVMEAAGLVREPGRRQGMWADADAQTAQARAFRSPDGVATMLGGAVNRLNAANEFEQLPDDMEVWLTEYNLFDRVGPVRGTWAHGLFAAVMTLRFLDEESIAITTFHSLYGGSAFNAIFAGDDEFGPLVVENPGPTTPYGLAATGEALRLIGKAMHGGGTAHKLDFESNPLVRVPADADEAKAYPALIGWAFRGAGQERRIIWNGSPQAFEVESTNLAGGNYSTISGDPTAYVTGPDSLDRRSGKIPDVLTVPPYSLTLLEQEK